MATHRFHKKDAGLDRYGIYQSELVRGRHLTENKDPLNSGEVDEGKALASIPSIFARPRFVETAFTHCEFNGKQESTYDKVVSKTLDLLEGLFHSKKGDYDFKPFYFEEQIKELQNSKHEGHKLLSSVLEREKSNMGNVDVIFLIEKKEDDIAKFLGGTSPFSFVYPSPDFVGNDAVKGLTSRSESFRLFMYRYYCAVLQENKADSPFWAFVGNSMADDISVLDGQSKPKPGSYSFKNLYADYEGVSCDDNGVEVPVVACSFLPILHRKPADFTSQLFVLSTRQEVLDGFNRITSPIILPTQDTPLYVCEQKSYKSTVLRNKECYGPKNDEEVRDIPGQEYQHPWVSAMDFFEDNLLVYPASINESAFVGTYKINDDKFVLPPLRTLFFKYFTINDIKEDNKNKMLCYERTSGGIKVTLEIPVCDENEKETGKVVIFKNYPIPDIKAPTFNVAISPFCRVEENPILNSYHIMMLHTTDCKDSSKQRMSFYWNNELKEGNPVDRTLLSKNNEGTTFYYVHDFNNIEISINGSTGRLIPEFNKAGDEADEYKYSVDFGTTNTNVAYKTTGDEENFDDAVIKEQIQYLSSVEEIAMAKLQFIPLDGVEYPIRTVMGSTKSISENVESLFGDSSIGFYYQKGILGDDDKIKYLPDLKWKMFRVKDESNGRGTLFMEEMLWQIKNHWMLHDHAAKTKEKCPQIVFTYPQDDDMGSEMLERWIPLYCQIFGVKQNVAKKYIKTVSESLAPCMLEQSTDDGFLNIDIGGGTTDIQYKKGDVCLYNSILFAADDIWGDGYEHVEFERLKQFAAKNRNNNRYRSLSNEDERTNGKLDKNMETRELLSFLFKNNPRLVKDNLAKSKNEKQESNAERRKPMFLHFAALMYHITKWLKANSNGVIPKTIKFTGMGSGYVKWLVGGDEHLTTLVSELISEYWGGNASNSKINVFTEEDVIEAKRKTSKGALGVFIEANPPKNSSKICIDIEDERVESSQCNSIDAFKDSYWPKVKAALKECFDGYNKVAIKMNNDNTLSCPTLLLEKIEDCAKDSFRNMANANKDELASSGVKDSLFIWALKNSLWQI